MPGPLRTCFLVVLTAAVSACAGRSPGAAVAPVPAEASEADTPAGWRGGKVGPPLAIENFELAPRSNGDLLRTPAMHVAMDDLRRLRLISAFQEMRLGLLRVATGDEFERGTSVAYNFARLHAAYSRSLDYPGDAVIEVWMDGRKIGECTHDGLLIGTEYSLPRK
jgi:hypothetical protein